MYPRFTIKAYYLLYALKIFSLCPPEASSAFTMRRKRFVWGLFCCCCLGWFALR